MWLTAARLGTNLLGFIGILFLARLLVPADFGLVALGTTMLSMITSVTSISLSQALIQHRDPTPDHFHTVWTLNVARTAIVALLFAAAGPSASIFYEDPRLANVMYVLSVGCLLTGLENPRTIMMTRDLVFWQQFMLQISQRIVNLVVAVTIAIIYQTYWALLLGTVAGQLVGVLVSYSVLPFRPQPKLKHVRELFSFSIWLTFSGIINTINWNFDQLMIAKFLGKTELGYYTVGNNLAVIPTRQATAPLTQTLFPAFAKVAHQRDRLASAYQAAQTLVTSISLPVGVGMALVADPLVRLAMGEKWLSAVPIIQVLSCVFGFQTVVSLNQPLAMAAGQTSLIFKRDVQAFLYRVPMLIIGMYLGGLIGVVYARAIAGTTGLFLGANVVFRVAGVSFLEQMRPNLRIFISTLSMAIIVLSVGAAFPASFDSFQNLLKIAITVPVGAACYVGTTLCLWAMMGKPKGPETEVLKVLAKVRDYLRRDKAA
jgi:PST family polysaccharide transporter